MHKYEITPLEDIYIDMECQGTENSPDQGVGHLNVYGIEGKQNDVGADVFDALYVLEKGEMVMQTALDNHHVRGVLVDENDKTSAVSVGYLEEGLLKIRDENNNKLFLVLKKVLKISILAQRISLLMNIKGKKVLKQELWGLH